MYIIQYASFSSNKIVLVLLNDVYYNDTAFENAKYQNKVKQNWFDIPAGMSKV